MKKTIAHLKACLFLEFQKEEAYLFPLRVFIGIGWIRASLDKLIAPGWYDGSTLAGFFQTHLTTGDERFPFYTALLQGIFSDYPPALGWLIMLGQMLVGPSILGSLSTLISYLRLQKRSLTPKP